MSPSAAPPAARRERARAAGRGGSGTDAAPGPPLGDERCAIETPLRRGWALSIYRLPPPLGSQRDPCSPPRASGLGPGAATAAVAALGAWYQLLPCQILNSAGGKVRGQGEAGGLLYVMSSDSACSVSSALEALEGKLSLGDLCHYYYFRSANVEQRFICHSLDPPRVRSSGARPSPVLMGAELGGWLHCGPDMVGRGDIETHIETHACLHIHAHLYTHIYTHICADLHRHTYAHIDTHIHAYIYIYTHIHTYIHIMQLCVSRRFLWLQTQEMGTSPRWAVLPTSRRYQSSPLWLQ